MTRLDGIRQKNNNINKLNNNVKCETNCECQKAYAELLSDIKYLLNYIDALNGAISRDFILEGR